MDETKTDNVIKFPVEKSPETEPKTKESSVLDFTYLSLDELESQVVFLFPNEKDSEGYFHVDLLSALSFRFIHNGWEKKELLQMFAEMVGESIDNLAEFESEDRKTT
jgi:hypothetical protein